MPPAKKQKTGADSSAPTHEEEAGPSSHHKSGENSKNDENDKGKEKGRDVTTIPPHEYVCVLRSYFDVEREVNLFPDNEEENEEDEVEDVEPARKKYIAIFDEQKASGKLFEPAANHPEWKFVMLWQARKMCREYGRRAKYCDPDMFGMYIYNDWCGWGLQELIENFIVAFDKELKKKGDDQLVRMWVVISALALWVNEADMFHFVGNESGDKVAALTKLMGCALLTTLAAIEDGNELNTTSKLLDLPQVISLMSYWARDIEPAGLEDAVEWVPHALHYFQKAGFEASKGVAGTSHLLETLKDDIKGAEKKKIAKTNPWGWTKMLKEYKHEHGTPRIGGTQFDITKMTRAERAGYAFKNKDPLADVSDKDLKEGNLDFV